ncbi:MAG: hypothetical protein M5U25_10190 [Planctomycetota bacterium]|nr:hypothetical protein [Planctomycetota bacterium]
MAVSAGTDYAIISKATWFFESGIGDCTAVFTRPFLFIFPHKTMSATSRTFTDTEYTIGGQKPSVAILALLRDPATTADSMVEQLLSWSSQAAGPIVERMEEFKRVRIFRGFIRRSVVVSKKEKGMDMGATGMRPTKEELPAFPEFFKDHPHLELK